MPEHDYTLNDTDTNAIIRAFQVVGEYEAKMIDNCDEAIEIFRRIGETLPVKNLAAMERVYYNLLNQAEAGQFSWPVVFAIREAILEAWYGIGEWRQGPNRWLLRK